MDVREKLVELLSEKCMETCKQRKGYVCSVDECRRCKEKCCGFYADHLIANGVTVQDGKPLDAFLHPVDAYKGLKAKYLVFKADTGERVGNCFVLRPDKDPAAVEAIRAYASATDNETLAEDIYNLVGKGEPVKEWISVEDRLPSDEQDVLVIAHGWGGRLVYVGSHKRVEAQKSWLTGITNKSSEWLLWGWSYLKEPMVTHWMPLPKPPEGE